MIPDSANQSYDTSNLESTTHVTKQALEAWRLGDWQLFNEALVTLRHRGDNEVLDIGTRLCKARTVIERQVGALILQRFDNDAFYETRLAAILSLISDKRISVLRYAIWSLGMMGDERAIEPLIHLKSHPSILVRKAVAEALSLGFEDDSVADALIEMSRDPDAEVRQLATFALGYQNFRDRQVIREALISRLDDRSTPVRGQAMVSLSHWREARILPFLKREMDEENGRGIGLISESLPEESLKRALNTLRDEWIAIRYDHELDWPSILAKAIAACRQGVQVN